MHWYILRASEKGNGKHVLRPLGYMYVHGALVWRKLGIRYTAQDNICIKKWKTLDIIKALAP